jgi:CheY-like chemotaxis protein/HPt (histidine-containing phosphotransfer) domain-containing protein
MEQDDYISIETTAIDLNRLFESLPGQVCWKDKNTIVMGCNDLQLKALGLQSKAEIIGRTSDDLIWQGVPDVEKQIQIKINAEIEKEIIRSGIASVREEHITNAEGVKNHLVLRIPLKKATDEAIGLLKIAIEIADTKRVVRRKKKHPPQTYNSPQQLQIPFDDVESSTLKILLVEDDPIASRTAKSLLENAAHEAEVEVAIGGVEAIMEFEPNKYDIIFTDLGLPHLDGYQFAMQWHKMEAEAEASRTPIVALTAYAPEDVHPEKIAAAGIDAILKKPLVPEKIVEILNRFVYHAKDKMQHLTQNPVTKRTENPYAKKSIDLAEGAKILGQNEIAAQKMLEDLLATLPEVRHEVEEAYRGNDVDLLQQIIHKFYGGLCYVGVPHLREAARELDHALTNQEKHQTSRLYQRMLDEMSALEKECTLLFPRKE